MHYPLFYKYVHYQHHTAYLINANTTYNHTLPDLIITNFLPIVATSAILPVSQYTLTTIFWYKAILEVSGHTGKDTSSSFIQCIYLPRLLGIPLYSRDHNKHHIQPKVNFSKRFCIWDKIFGTYSSERENIEHK
jgi:sterol desaturase/sphingolipid hydroxylase (fatty acid hydroxylase superfamily)